MASVCLWARDWPCRPGKPSKLGQSVGANFDRNRLREPHTQHRRQLSQPYIARDGAMVFCRNSALHSRLQELFFHRCLALHPNSQFPKRRTLLGERWSTPCQLLKSIAFGGLQICHCLPRSSGIGIVPQSALSRNNTSATWPFFAPFTTAPLRADQMSILPRSRTAMHAGRLSTQGNASKGRYKAKRTLCSYVPSSLSRVTMTHAATCRR